VNNTCKKKRKENLAFSEGAKIVAAGAKDHRIRATLLLQLLIIYVSNSKMKSQKKEEEFPF